MHLALHNRFWLSPVAAACCCSHCTSCQTFVAWWPCTACLSARPPPLMRVVERALTCNVDRYKA